MLRSIIVDKVEVRNSLINGIGMFAKQKINKGEIVFIKGGHILEKEKIFTTSTINSYLPIDDDYFIGASNIEEEEAIKLFNNHSCDPNCGLRGEITFVAIKDIYKDEELTCDYAFIDNEDYQFKCQCGSLKCRKIVTGKDWMINELQEEYFCYFARYLQEKIIALKQ